MPYLDFNTTKIYYIDSGDRNAPALVFIHGLTSSSKIYSRQIEFFNKTHRCIAFDLVGHGKSYRPSPDVVDHAVAGQTAILEALLEHLQISSATLVAWSLGGFIAAEYAHRHPEKVEALVMIGTSARFIMTDDDASYPSNPVAIFDWWTNSYKETPQASGTGFVFSQYPEASPEKYPEYVAEALQDTWSVTPEALIGSMRGFEDHREYYPQFKCPVLFIHGADDGPVSVETSKWGAGVVAGEKKLVVYEGFGHVPHVSNAIQVNRDMAAFLVRSK